MLFSETDWTSALIASALLLFGALIASNMLARAAAEQAVGRFAALGVGATSLGAMIWTAAIALDRLDAAPLDGAGVLAAAALAALVVLYLMLVAVDGAPRRNRVAATAALVAIAAVTLLALVALGEAGAFAGPTATALRLALVAGACTLGMRLASRRKRFSHFAIAAVGLIACVALEPAPTPETAPNGVNVSAIETHSIGAPVDDGRGLTAAAMTATVLTLLFGASVLFAGAPVRAAGLVFSGAGRRPPSTAAGTVFAALARPRAAEIDPEEQIARALESAIRNRELDIDIQPQRRLSDGALLGGEALVRWRRGPHAGLRPDQFVPAAEKHGVIDALGAYALREGCAAATRWPQALHVAVNVSPIQLQSPAFEATLRRVLAETGLSPRRLELELTETAFSDQDAFDPTVIDRIRALGVSISIDDFGRGQSSLARLQSLPVDQIKLDRSLVSAVETSRAARAIVRSVVDLAQELGVKVLAEGVETLDQIDFHQTAGCSVVQGFAIGRPMPADAFPREAPPWPLARDADALQAS